MSFLYSDEVLSYLESELNKAAQAAQPASTLNPRQVRNVALGLIDNLKRAYTPIQTEGAGNLTAQDVYSLDHLIPWIANNKVKYNGNYIAVPNFTEASKYKGVPYAEYDLGLGGGKNNRGGQGGGGNPYVWRDGLVAFLEDLRKQAANSGNRLFSEQVSNVINQANKLPSLGVSLDEEERPNTAQEQKSQQGNQSGQAGNAGQPGNQSSTQQGQNPQAEATKEIAQAVAPGGNVALPFDTGSNQINPDLMYGFLRAMEEVINKPAFKSQMSNYYNMFANSVQQTKMALDNFLANATPEARNGGFQLDPTNPDAFVNTWARSDPNPYAKARMMLNTLVPVLQGIANIVSSIQSSITLTEIFTKPVITQQYNTGLKYMQSAQSMISRITSALTSRR